MRVSDWDGVRGEGVFGRFAGNVVGGRMLEMEGVKIRKEWVG